MADVSPRKCASCGSLELQDGVLGVRRTTFIPQGKFMWIGYTVNAFVCLNCGYVGHYLLPSAVEDIRKHARR